MGVCCLYSEVFRISYLIVLPFILEKQKKINVQHQDLGSIPLINILFRIKRSLNFYKYIFKKSLKMEKLL